MYANVRKWHFDQKRETACVHVCASVEANVYHCMLCTVSDDTIRSMANHFSLMQGTSVQTVGQGTGVVINVSR